MSMRIGTVNGKPCKRVRKNSNGKTVVQPVRKERVDGVDTLVNDGDQFEAEVGKFIKGRV